MSAFTNNSAFRPGFQAAPAHPNSDWAARYEYKNLNFLKNEVTPASPLTSTDVLRFIDATKGQVAKLEASGSFNNSYTGNSTGDGTWAVKFNANDLTNRIIAGSNTNAKPFIFLVSSTVIRVRTTDDVNNDFTIPTLSTSTWYDLIITRISGVFRLYIGVTESSTGGIADTGTFDLGRIGTYQSAGFEWDGLLDDFIYYDSGLNQTQITALVAGNPPAGFAATYQFNTGLLVDELDLNNLSQATAFGGVVDGVRGEVVAMNGTTDALSDAYNGNADTDGTWSFWVNTNTLVSKMIAGSSVSNKGFLFLANATTLRLFTQPSATKNFTVPTMLINTWYYVTVTRSGDSFNVYLNDTVSSTGAQTLTGTFGLNLIGDDNANPALKWDGEQDISTYWDRSSSAAQVAENYNFELLP